MEISKKYISLCDNRGIQDLCRWTSGDRFLIKSQELFCFLEKMMGWDKDSKCTVWVPNFETSFEIQKNDLLWVPNLSQVISSIKEQALNLKKISLEYIDEKWVFNAYYNTGDKEKPVPIVTFAKTAKAACLKALIEIVNLNKGQQ